MQPLEPPPPPKPVSFLSAAIQQTQQKEQTKHQGNDPTKEREPVEPDEWAVTSEPEAGIGLGLTPHDGDEKGGTDKKEFFKKLATSKAPLRWTPDLNPISTATTFVSQNQSNLNPNLNSKNMNSNSYGYPNPSSPNPPLSPQHRHLHANTSSATNSIPASMYRRPSRSVSANTITHPSSNSQSAAWSNSTNIPTSDATAWGWEFHVEVVCVNQ
ncbi:hypothetical protein BJ741DRAFT_226456 [Chytriomyces cf. hyalinus JEL632]|nr:hypothetical protein BJ741DRAFT_226456 [Chytriomyces cf. hyalinus JEL632]